MIAKPEMTDIALRFLVWQGRNFCEQSRHVQRKAQTHALYKLARLGRQIGINTTGEQRHQRREE